MIPASCYSHICVITSSWAWAGNKCLASNEWKMANVMGSLQRLGYKDTIASVLLTFSYFLSFPFSVTTLWGRQVAVLWVALSHVGKDRHGMELMSLPNSQQDMSPANSHVSEAASEQESHEWAQKSILHHSSLDMTEA